jgi:two-component system chemotaxis response regulator CheY
MARVLVVDDSAVMRNNLKSMLSHIGHSIAGEAPNGLKAVKEYERCTPDLVTMDITMPLYDGLYAVKNIIEINPDARIIMISALNQKSMVLEAIEMGAKHYIIKPVTIEKLQDVINFVMK